MPGPTRVRAVLGFKRKNVPVVLARSKFIHGSLLGNPTLFQSPNPDLATLLSQIQALDGAQVLVGAGTKGLAATRDIELHVLWTSLELLLKFVQALCDAASPEQAVALIELAGMKVARAPTHGKALIEIRQKQPGTVVLSANVSLLTGGKRSKKTSFNWRYTLDGGQTWVQPLSTPVGSVVIGGLPPLTRVGFCVSLSDAEGPGEWSDTVTFLVH